MTVLLDVQECTKQFGGLTAVNKFSLQLRKGELAGLIGPNGAGKTTAFNLLTGVYQPTSGDIVFDGASIAGRKPSQIAAIGICRTFQNIRLFPGCTVLDNIKTAAHLHFRPSLTAAILGTPGFRAAERDVDDQARALLARFGLEKYADEFSTSLPYGEQRRLEIARALATRPKLLLLDEPAAGMNPQEKNDLMTQIRALRDDFDLTVLLIEHDMKLVMGICERILVLDYGQTIAEGTPKEIQQNKKVIEAYLGEGGLTQMLTIKDLNVYYGAIQGVSNLSLTVEKGEIVTLIGANGAGKSTTLRAISGLVKAKSGTITLEDEEITNCAPDAIVRRGIGHSPEGRRVFANMTVRENLELGAYTRRDAAGIKSDFERILTLFPRLKERIGQNAGTLSGGEQQMLAMGRALMGRPRVLLLDEPSLGLAPFLVRDIFAIIRDINAQGTTILLVEQNAHMALGVASRGYVLETGTIILTDEAKALLTNDRIRSAYLGE